MSFRPDAPQNIEIVKAFNTGLGMLENSVNTAVPGTPEWAKLNDQLTFTRVSLRHAGQPSIGISNPYSIAETFAHDFSRTGERVDVKTGIFTGGVLGQLRQAGEKHAREGFILQNRKMDGILINQPAMDAELELAVEYQIMGNVLNANSVPFTAVYDEKHPDWEAAIEAYTYLWTHKNIEGLDSKEVPSLAHNEEDWQKTISLLKNERILQFPPEELIKKRRNWWGCLPLIAAGIGLGAIVCATQQTGQEQVPSVVATAAAKGQPPIGIIPPSEGIIRPVFAPSPDTGQVVAPVREELPAQTEKQPEVGTSLEDCEPGIELIITEIIRQGDSDANRFYSYRGNVNPEGNSVKGLLEKELASWEAKNNPNAAESIRYNLRNQPNQGRNIQPGDPDLARLVKTAQDKLGQPVVDAAYLAFIDSIRRNNPDGTLEGDKIMATDFKAQSPESIIRRLQAIQKP